MDDNVIPFRRRPAPKVEDLDRPVVISPADLVSPLLDVRGAAEFLGRSEHAIRHLRARGKLQPIPQVDRRVFFHVNELKRFLSASQKGEV